MGGDWIKLHRSILDSAVWPDDFMVKLWLWCLMKANYADKPWKSIVVKRGQFVTGQHRGSDELGVSPARWYRGMKQLEAFGNLTMEANNHFTIVTICKYETYQGDDRQERIANELPLNSERIANEYPANSQRIADEYDLRIKEGKNSRKEESNTPPNPQGGTAGAEANGRRPRKGKAAYRVEDQAYPPELDTDEFRAAWQTWTLHRHEIGHPMTPTAAAKTLAKCAKWGAGRAVAAIDHSAGNGWQGLFEPDPAKANGTRPLGYDPDPRGTFAAAAAWMESKKREEGNANGQY